MRKNYLIIVLLIIFFSLLFSICQYYNAFKTEGVSATSVIPNPGHAWSSMECNSDSLCIDTVNNRLGIGTNAPTKTLDVVGDIKLTGNIYLGG